MSDDWKGEHLIRAPKPSASERANVVTLRNYAAQGVSMAEGAKRLGMGMERASRLATLYRITFMTGKARV